MVMALRADWMNGIAWQGGMEMFEVADLLRKDPKNADGEPFSVHFLKFRKRNTVNLSPFSIEKLQK